MTEPELGTAEDFKIDMHVVRSQTNDHPSFAAVRKTPCWCYFFNKTIILPRQAQDKHRENSRTEAFLAG
jgi:hypothetical protein